MSVGMLYLQEEKQKEREAEIEAVKQSTKSQHVNDAALKKEAEAAEKRARSKARGKSGLELAQRPGVSQV